MQVKQPTSQTRQRFLHRFSMLPVGFLFVFALHMINVVGADIRTIGSPNGRIRVDVRMPQPGTAERPRWEASIGGKRVLCQCSLGLET
jgi:hypothetical protein